MPGLSGKKAIMGQRILSGLTEGGESEGMHDRMAKQGADSL